MERILPEKLWFCGPCGDNEYTLNSLKWLKYSIRILETSNDWRKIKKVLGELSYILNSHLIDCYKFHPSIKYQDYKAYILPLIKDLYNRMISPPDYKWDGLFKIEIRKPGRPRKKRAYKKPWIKNTCQVDF
ncbi:hypothetical protein [Desulfospira joergensenii]|uniref:hypothetical protein n=1 Tax=Desulfospira joergensenii TaxID=53329 RepID=UPI0003B43A64|nr:hypothetical protein [Desulfospira joergensenii]